MNPQTGFDIWTVPIETTSSGLRAGKPEAFLQTKSFEVYTAFSPDGKWLAYGSNESGTRQVYVRAFPTGKGKWPISIAGGEQPRWRGDGKELFFISADKKMMAVAVKAVAGARPSLEPASPQTLFDAHLATIATVPLFECDVTADAKRFLLTTVGSSPSPRLTVWTNWDAGLKK